jgi:hypothetical protein
MVLVLLDAAMSVTFLIRECYAIGMPERQWRGKVKKPAVLPALCPSNEASIVKFGKNDDRRTLKKKQSW